MSKCGPDGKITLASVYMTIFAPGSHPSVQYGCERMVSVEVRVIGEDVPFKFSRGGQSKFCLLQWVVWRSYTLKIKT